ncbi:MAG: BamA/TamA family outer membrane protein [Zetaproteobacteria bacterium]|nr:BamA/TamA family outer membrane protein [Zetaproteobacteria bacterium]
MQYVKWKWCLYLCLMYINVPWVLCAQPTLSSNSYRWKFAEKLAGVVNEVSAAEGLPERVASSQELKELLERISDRFDLIDLTARVDHHLIVIDGVRAKKIRSIQIVGTLGDLSSAMVREMRNRFLRQVYTSESVETILRASSDFLRYSGFPNASVSISSREVSESLDIQLQVSIANPCVISEVRILPEDRGEVARRLNLVGEVCQLSAIRERVRTTEQALVADGYLNAKLEMLPLDYGDQLESASVRISSSLGKKVMFLVEDDSQLLSFRSLLEDSSGSSIGTFTSSVEETESEIRRHFLKLGYEDVNVSSPVVTQINQDTEQYKFKVTRGPFYTLKSVTFSGNTRFSQRELWDMLGYSSLAFSTEKLDREDIENRLERVKRLYRENGFLDMKVASIRYSKKASLGTVECFVLIQEGMQRKFQGHYISGLKYFERLDIQKHLPLAQGNPLDLAAVLEYKNTILAKYQDAGFLQAEVKVDLSHKRRLRWIDTHVNVSVNEKQRTRIRSIEILGLVKTATVVVQRELQFEEGDFLSLEALSRTRRKLLDLGIFRSVQVSPYAISKRDYIAGEQQFVDIVVDLTEADLGYVAFGPGYSLAKGFRYSSEFSFSNFDGHARKVTIRAGISEERKQVKITDDKKGELKTLLGRKLSLSFLEPYVWNLPVDGKFSFIHQATAAQLWQISNRFQFSVLSKLDWLLEGLSMEPIYIYKLNQDLGPTSLNDSLVATGNAEIGSVGVKFVLDRRNDPSWPTSGYLAVVNETLARPYFLGDFSYLRNHFGGVAFLALSEQLVWRNKAYFTIFSDVERQGSKLGGVLPYSERLSAIGTSGVRGFVRELGPYVRLPDGSKEAIRGTRRTLLTTELRWRFDGNKAFHVFMDSGTTFLSDSELGKFRRFFEQSGRQDIRVESNIGYSHAKLIENPEFLLSKHYASTGFGFSFITPIGPFEVQVAWPMVEPKSDICLAQADCFPRGKQQEKWYKNFQLYFNIGADQAG